MGGTIHLTTPDWGGSRLSRRAGASLRQRVASRGRGAAERSAVAGIACVGAEARVTAHAPAPRKKAARVRELAPLSSQNKGERGEGVLKERTLTGGFKMVAHIKDRQEPILILSDSEGGDPLGNSSKKGVMSELESVGRGEHSLFVQWVPRMVSPILHKVQHWDVENRTLIQTGLVEVRNKGECRLAGVAFEEAELGDSCGGVQVSEDFGNLVCDQGVPGCGKALASGGQEEHMSEAGQGRPAFNSGHTVGVSTPLRHLEEERVSPGVAHPTSGDAVLSSQVWKRYMAYDEPSTSQSASGLIRDMGFEESLDFDEGNETVAMVGGIPKDVGGQGNNQYWSFGVLQGQKKAAVQSDRRDVERSVSGSAGNFP
ncbi:hypothetical protein NDU88_002459 [Pleurodeles waltl]|uniref:Uncharacterized protein n=1 Tax=Pleurodeles waltl TaxID=8319 RepID=A0AAV7RA13_PLEWA|nr:hypothetical protein NDU88_002459 [Pleurodeles waltl]